MDSHTRKNDGCRRDDVIDDVLSALIMLGVVTLVIFGPSRELREDERLSIPREDASQPLTATPEF